MSIKNKTLGRNDIGKIRRDYTSRTNYAVHWGAALKVWRYLYMTRPKRRETTDLCKSILRGQDPEGAVFPLGNHKPHHYYW